MKATNPQRVTGDCSICGGEGRGDEWFVFRAGLVDVDGIYYARACGDSRGAGGCLESLKDEQKVLGPEAQEQQMKASILLDMMPEEADDFIVTELND